MKPIKKQTLYSMILTGMALGTAWAIRGQFGHEQGAAWAGGIGCLALLLLAKRQDWYNKAVKAAFAGAVGWGLGGMMSYGAVVGYGRGTDFLNVFYGLSMLFVIGGLYGFIGGGLFGLTLADTQKQKIKWHRLISEMAVGGIIFYYFIIEQLGMHMTPPRSEAWGVCAGIALALLYFMARKKLHGPIRVAVFAGLGGGIGFAFGNFLQVMGNVAEIPFNMWNVMEYSLGFFGGAGMAYGVYTASWPKEEAPVRQTNYNLILPLMGLVLIIPFFVWQQSLTTRSLQPTMERLMEGGDPLHMVRLVQWIGILAFLLPAIYWIRHFSAKKHNGINQMERKEINTLFIGYFSIYLIFTFLITGSFMSFYRIEQFLYLINFAIILFAIPRISPIFQYRKTHERKWLKVLLSVIVFIAILALIAISTHGEMPGINKRFE